MSEPFDEGTEERLRAILRSEADSVEPSPEALNMIRERTQSRRSPLWSGLPWLRPVVAVGAAAAIAGSVLMGTPQLRDQIFFAANDTGTPQQQERPEGDGAGEATDFTSHDDGRAEQEGTGGGQGGGAASPTEEDEERRTQELPAHCRTPEPPGSESPVATATGRSDQDEGDGQELPPECDPDKEPDEGDGDGGGDSGDGGSGDGGGGDDGSGGDGSDGDGDGGGSGDDGGDSDGGSDGGGSTPTPDEPDPGGTDGGGGTGDSSAE
ncbi:hypothetical protein [Nocardiopsis halophila]|uniref:hypothetical protein n=1 Tax=Nocardiopsis halophila TaxID=141692 RepID=UPI000349E424|nr:hypothetical protein [Nocardiopsis halophila]